MRRRVAAPHRHSPSRPSRSPALASIDRSAVEAPPILRTRWAIAALTALVLARAAYYSLLGPGFVGDEWSLAGAMHLDGHQGRFILESRPGSWLVFTAVFWLAGLHPSMLFAIVTLLYLAVVTALFMLLSRFLATPTALAVAAVWVLEPTHNTITVWGATTNSLIGMLLGLAGLLVLTRGRWLAAGLLMAASVLCYELSTPVLLLAALLLPASWQLRPAERAVRPAERAALFAMVAAAAWWSTTHSVYEATLRVPNPAVLWSAHFGSGLFATAAVPSVLRFACLGLSAVGVVVGVALWVRGDRGRESGTTLVVAGLAVMAIGAWTTFTLPIAAFGVVDRLYALSSVGAALIVVGFIRYLHDHWPPLAPVAGVGFVALCLLGQVVSLRSWSQAGQDSVTLLRYLDRTYEDAGGRRFVVGPVVPSRNGISGISGGHAKWSMWVYFDARQGSLRTATTPAEFVAREAGEILVDWSDVSAAAATGSGSGR